MSNEGDWESSEHEYQDDGMDVFEITLAAEDDLEVSKKAKERYWLGGYCCSLAWAIRCLNLGEATNYKKLTGLIKATGLGDEGYNNKNDSYYLLSNYYLKTSNGVGTVR